MVAIRSWGTEYGRSMEELAFCYDRHEGSELQDISDEG